MLDSLQLYHRNTSSNAIDNSSNLSIRFESPYNMNLNKIRLKSASINYCYLISLKYFMSTLCCNLIAMWPLVSYLYKAKYKDLATLLRVIGSYLISSNLLISDNSYSPYWSNIAPQKLTGLHISTCIVVELVSININGSFWKADLFEKYTIHLSAYKFTGVAYYYAAPTRLIADVQNTFWNIPTANDDPD